MGKIEAGLIIVGLVPIGCALWAHRGTSLQHALCWAVIAWLSWGAAYWVDGQYGAGGTQMRYVALCLTGAAGIAVLGARRPHVFAWNFVVLALLAVMFLPLLEIWVIGTQSLQGLRTIFLVGALAIAVINYFPTRFYSVVIWLVVCGTGQVLVVCAPTWLPGRGESIVFDVMLAKAPWFVWLATLGRYTGRSPIDQLWIGFRDSWGLVWSQRVREQFNNAAENAGWPVRLAWDGLTVDENGPALTPTDEEKITATLRAVLQRFLRVDQNL